jgi:hypothetical protein
MARNQLTLSRYEADMVLLPDDAGNVSEAVRVTVFGLYFPQRAVEPEIMVGDATALRVSVAPDQRSIRGFFRRPPADGGVIRVRYGDSQEGVLEGAFSRRNVRPLPRACG